jgi:hypothetical protein
METIAAWDDYRRASMQRRTESDCADTAPTSSPGAGSERPAISSQRSWQRWRRSWPLTVPRCCGTPANLSGQNPRVDPSFIAGAIRFSGSTPLNIRKFHLPVIGSARVCRSCVELGSRPAVLGPVADLASEKLPARPAVVCRGKSLLHNGVQPLAGPLALTPLPPAILCGRDQY